MEPSFNLNDLPPELIEQISLQATQNIPALQRTSVLNNAVTTKAYSDFCDREPIRTSEVEKFLDRVVGCGNNEFTIFFSFHNNFLLNTDSAMRIAGTSFISSTISRELRTNIKSLTLTENSSMFISDTVAQFKDNPTINAVARLYQTNVTDMKILFSKVSNDTYSKIFYTKIGTVIKNEYTVPGAIVELNLGGGPVYSAHHPRFGVIDWCSAVEFDFASQYYIFNQRLGCVKRNPNYARDRIVAAVKSLVASSDTGDVVSILFSNTRLVHEMRIAGYFDYEVMNVASGPVPSVVTAGTPVLPFGPYGSLQEVQELNRLAGERLIEFYSKL